MPHISLCKRWNDCDLYNWTGIDFDRLWPNLIFNLRPSHIDIYWHIPQIHEQEKKVISHCCLVFAFRWYSSTIPIYNLPIAGNATVDNEAEQRRIPDGHLSVQVHLLLAHDRAWHWSGRIRTSAIIPHAGNADGSQQPAASSDCSEIDVQCARARSVCVCVGVCTSMCSVLWQPSTKPGIRLLACWFSTIYTCKCLCGSCPSCAHVSPSPYPDTYLYSLSYSCIHTNNEHRQCTSTQFTDGENKKSLHVLSHRKMHSKISKMSRFNVFYGFNFISGNFISQLTQL